MCHAEFGCVTLAKHFISFKGVERSVLIPISPLPRTLRHVLDAAMPDAVQEIPAPSPLPDPIPRSPIYFDGLMHPEGLFSVTRPSADIACQNVLKATGWGRRCLSAAESLRAFEVSLAMDTVLLTQRRARTLLQRWISPIIVTAIVCNLWKQPGGGIRGDGHKANPRGPATGFAK